MSFRAAAPARRRNFGDFAWLSTAAGNHCTFRISLQISVSPLWRRRCSHVGAERGTYVQMFEARHEIEAGALNLPNDARVDTRKMFYATEHAGMSFRAAAPARRRNFGDFAWFSHCGGNNCIFSHLCAFPGPPFRRRRPSHVGAWRVPTYRFLKRDTGSMRKLSIFSTTLELTTDISFTHPNGGNKFSGRRTGPGPEFLRFFAWRFHCEEVHCSSADQKVHGRAKAVLTRSSVDTQKCNLPEAARECIWL